MSMRNIAAAALLLGTVFASSAFAATITSLDPFWVMTDNNPATWVLPANLGPCGTENEPICEPVGLFVISQPIAGPITDGYVTLTDSDGVTASDYLVWGNIGPLGTGLLAFYSDPAFPASLPTLNLGSLCIDDPDLGCVAPFNLTLANGAVLHMLVASDGESVFDPFGAGFDTGDGISFLNANAAGVPEPATLALFGAGLAGLGALRRRKARKSA